MYTKDIRLPAQSVENTLTRNASHTNAAAAKSHHPSRDPIIKRHTSRDERKHAKSLLIISPYRFVVQYVVLRLTPSFYSSLFYNRP